MAHRRPGRRRKRRVAPPSGTPAPSQPAPAKAVPAQAAAPVAVQDPLIGQVIGRCRIEARIGMGRTSTVYRAEHEALGRTVAVKILLPKSAANPQLVERFETEARAIAKIDNENVVKVYDVGAEGDIHFLVMELLDGEEIYEVLKRDGHLEVMDALRATRQAANGLKAAHTREIVHRDVKPQNMILLEDGTVKVVDFGLAAPVAGGGERVGTPHFMAPETCEVGVNEAASDIYSLGISLYLMLTGSAPYAGKKAVAEILQAHVDAKPLRPEAKRPGLPKEVGALVRQLTAKNPAERPTAGQVIEELDRFGGEAVQDKGGLRRRRKHMRAHIAGKRQSQLPLVMAIVLVAGALIAFVVLGSKKKDEDPVDRSSGPRTTHSVPTTPSTDLPVVVPDAPRRPNPSLETPPAPPPDQPAPPEDPEDAANRALFQLEAWARKNWHTADDDGAVIGKYETLARDHPGTAAAKEAKQRARDIRNAKIHAHPDKELAAGLDIEQARNAWKTALPEIETMISRHLYIKAAGSIPQAAADDRGPIGKELTFWKLMLAKLREFKTGLMIFVKDLPEAKRQIQTAQGMGTVLKITDQHVTVEIDGKKHDLSWADVPPAQLAALARRAFQEEDVKYLVDTMAFAFAHRLWEAYYAVDFDVGMSDLTSEQEFLVKQFHERQAERKAGG